MKFSQFVLLFGLVILAHGRWIENSNENDSLEERNYDEVSNFVVPGMFGRASTYGSYDECVKCIAEKRREGLDYGRAKAQCKGSCKGSWLYDRRSLLAELRNLLNDE